MKLLAIDACTQTCSVSLYCDGAKYSRFVKDVEKSANLILPLCDELVKESSLDIRDLDAIIYTKGPGTFTGIRMCVGVVQGLSFAHNIPTLGFSTLELLAYGALKKYNTKRIAVALDARMGEVYWGIYQNECLSNESVSKPTEVDYLGERFFGVGTAWGIYEKELVKKTGIMKYQSNFHPKAINLIDLVLTRYRDYNFSYDLPLPSYLRNNVAIKSLK